MRSVRLNENGLRRVIRKIVAEQAGRAGSYSLDSAFSDFVRAFDMDDSTDDQNYVSTSKAAKLIRKLTSKDEFGYQEISNGLVNAGMDKDDADEFAFGIQNGDY